MDTTTRAASPLRQRMLEDMRMRKLEPKTQEGYIRAVRKLTGFLERSPDTATVEDLRNFQLHLVDTGTSPITLNATLTGLKFFFDITLGRGELMARMQPVKLPRTVPVVLSMQEAAALIAAARNIKHQAALSVAYGAGLRASEVCRLKVGDVDSQRMALRVEQGKGAKDRYAMLSPVVLQRLRAWWRIGHAQGKILPSGWLFPGLDVMEPLSARQLNHAHVAPLVRHPPAGAQGRHPRDPGAAGPQEAGDDIDLRPRGHRPAARGDRTAGGVAAIVVRPAPWGGPLWRSPTSSVNTAQLGARRNVAI
jgi:integrase